MIIYLNFQSLTNGSTMIRTIATGRKIKELIDFVVSWKMILLDIIEISSMLSSVNKEKLNETILFILELLFSNIIKKN